MNKLLISAYAVSPIRGSECAVGWEIVTRLSVSFSVTVLVCERTPSGNSYYDEIIDFNNKGDKRYNIEFIPVPMPEKSKKYTLLHDNGFWPAYYWGYKCWQKEAYIKAKELHARKKFDIVYQLNMIGFREPGYLWKLNVPFIWGPTNGFHSIPFEFIKFFKGKDFIFQTLKHISNEIQIKLSFRPKKAAKKAEIVWCVDRIAYENLLKWGAKAQLMQETGLSVLPEQKNKFKSFNGQRKLNIVWSGMITPGKALFILIEALIKINSTNFKLTIIGDGPLTESMKILSEPINCEINWLGWIDREKVLEEISQSDILIFTSLKEATSVTIMEALSYGIPVICHDTCGMGIVVNDKNGFKIPYVNSEVSINYLSKLLVDILENPQRLNDKFQSIWETIPDLTWDNKVKEIASKIDEILDN